VLVLLVMIAIGVKLEVGQLVLAAENGMGSWPLGLLAAAALVARLLCCWRAPLRLAAVLLHHGCVGIVADAFEAGAVRPDHRRRHAQVGSGDRWGWWHARNSSCFICRRRELGTVAGVGSGRVLTPHAGWLKRRAWLLVPATRPLSASVTAASGCRQDTLAMTGCWSALRRHQVVARGQPRSIRYSPQRRAG
jgi:hypothetical protein